MSKEKRADAFYKILGLFEDADTDDKFTAYLKYLSRLCVKLRGRGDMEAYETVRGLHEMGHDVSHDTVKSVVFHLIGGREV